MPKASPLIPIDRLTAEQAAAKLERLAKVSDGAIDQGRRVVSLK
jgi:hypothetical protein